MTAASGEPTVESLAVTAYRIPTDAPEADGTLSWDSTTVVVVKAHADGHEGLGWSYAPAAAAHVVTELLSSVVVGRSALDPLGANEVMSRAVRNAGRQGIAATAISAVDIALWDLHARVLGVPLHRLLGGDARPIDVYGSGGFTTYDEKQTTTQVTDWVERCGVRAVKIKVGESWGSRTDRDLERAGQVRRLVGEGCELFVDANGGYTVGQAVRVGRRYDELGVSWFEEPVSSDDLAGLRRIRGEVVADVAAGEYGYDLPYFARMVDAQAVDCLQIDATRCGGITTFLQVAAGAQSRGLDVSAHCAPHLHAAFAGVAPNLRHIEYFHDHTRIEERLLLDGATEAAGGQLRPDAQRPGHGMSLRAGETEHWRIA